MGKLEDLNRELYNPKRDTEVKPGFFGKLRAETEAARAWPEARAAKTPKVMKKQKFFSPFFIVALVVFLIGVLAALGTFYAGFQSQDLVLTVFVKDKVESGERVTYRILYKNQAKDALKNVELVFTFPEGAMPLTEGGEGGRVRIPLQDIPPGKAAELELDARLFGKEGDAKKGEAAILYRLASGSDSFIVKAFAVSTVVRVPLAVSLNIPAELISGQGAQIAIDYTSSAQAPFENISLGVDYPPGFTFESADPPPASDNSIWTLGKIDPGVSGKIVIKGKIEGAPAEHKLFTAQVGVYRPASRDWLPYQVVAKDVKMASPLLSIEQKVNEGRGGLVRPGETISYRLRYKNHSDIPLNSIQVEVAVSRDLIDAKTLAPVGGIVEGASGKLIWNEISYPAFKSLPPKSEGDLSFTVAVQSKIPAGTKNPAVESVARIFSKSPPRSLAGLDLSYRDTTAARISGSLDLTSRLVFRSRYFEAEGVLPPRTGKETVYTVIWQVSNGLNNLENAEVRGTLAPGAIWKKTYLPKDSALGYDANSGVIVWRAGNLEANSAVGRESPYAAFRIGFTASPGEIGKIPILVKDIAASAKDAFSGETLTAKERDLTTALETDSSTASADWVVKE